MPSGDGSGHNPCDLHINAPALLALARRLPSSRPVLIPVRIRTSLQNQRGGHQQARHEQTQAADAVPASLPRSVRMTAVMGGCEGGGVYFRI